MFACTLLYWVAGLETCTTVDTCFKHAAQKTMIDTRIRYHALFASIHGDHIGQPKRQTVVAHEALFFFHINGDPVSTLVHYVQLKSTWTANLRE